MKVENALKLVGLNESETSVYLFVLEHGISSPSEIAKGTDIQRTNTYHILNSLVGNGLLKKQMHGKRNRYVANDPEAVLLILEKKKDAMKEVLPDLRAIHNTQKHKPVIYFYEGPEEVKGAYMRAASAHEEIHAIGSTEKIEHALPGFLTALEKTFKKRGIVMNDLLIESARGKTAEIIRDIMGGLYNQRFLDSRYRDVPTDILIWDDHVLLVTLDEPLFATEIINWHLANTFRMLFDIAWRASK